MSEPNKKPKKPAKKPQKKGRDPTKKTVEIDGKEVRVDQMDAEQALRLVEKLGVKIPKEPFWEYYQRFKRVKDIPDDSEWQEVYSQFYEFDEYELDIDITETDNDVEDYDNERRFKELVKCAESFAYFCHKYVKVLHPTLGLIPLIMYKYQRRVTHEYDTYRFNILSKFRQGGLTTTAVIWAMWRCMFRTDQQILVMSITDRESITAGEVVRIALEKLPSWMREGIAKLKEDSKHEKVFQETDSAIRFYTPKAARGKSVTILIVDEAAFIPNMDDHWKAMYPTLSAGGAAIVISTVHGIGNWYQEEYYRAEAGESRFHAIEMDYWEHPDYVTPSWVRDTYANIGDKGWAQEVLRSFLGSGETYIPATLIGEMEKFTNRHKPLRVAFREWRNPGEKRLGWEDGALWFWKNPRDGHEYIVSADCAEGVGNEGDNSCLQVIDVTTLEQCAEFYSNSIPADPFSQIAYNLATLYNVATLVVENNGIGAAVAQLLQQSLSYENLYYDRSKKKSVQIPGLKAGPQNRPVYLEAFQRRVVNGTVRIYSRRLVHELTTFMYNPATRKAEAQKRKHDDAILAMSLALYVRDTFLRDIPVGAEVPEEVTQVFNTAMFREIQMEIMRDGKSEWLPDEPQDPFLLPFVNDDRDDKSNMIFVHRKNDALLREFNW